MVITACTRSVERASPGTRSATCVRSNIPGEPVRENTGTRRPGAGEGLPARPKNVKLSSGNPRTSPNAISLSAPSRPSTGWLVSSRTRRTSTLQVSFNYSSPLRRVTAKLASVQRRPSSAEWRCRPTLGSAGSGKAWPGRRGLCAVPSRTHRHAEVVSQIARTRRSEPVPQTRCRSCILRRSEHRAIDGTPLPAWTAPARGPVRLTSAGRRCA